MKSRLILVGEAASGKDYARKICEDNIGMSYQVSYTTRPPRKGEVHGKDYFFLSESAFTDLIRQNFWYEYVKFNSWYYGTSNEQFSAKNAVFIMTPTGLSHLSEKDRAESFVIYFEIDKDIRRERMHMRKGNADSVERRLEADARDFAKFSNYDTVINHSQFTIKDISNCVYANVAIESLAPLKHFHF